MFEERHILVLAIATGFAREPCAALFLDPREIHIGPPFGFRRKGNDHIFAARDRRTNARLLDILARCQNAGKSRRRIVYVPIGSVGIDGSDTAILGRPLPKKRPSPPTSIEMIIGFSVS
jgi:hypothetical protein